MAKGKSIIEKFTDTVKDIASSASEALKAEEPPKVEQTNAAYMPLAAEGLVADPLLVPPVAMRPVPVQPPRRKRTARKTARKSRAREGESQPRCAEERTQGCKNICAKQSESGFAECSQGIGQADHQNNRQEESQTAST